MIRRIAKNTLFLSASQIAARAIGFFYFIFLARALGVESFGIYNFTLAFIYNFIPVADFGLERLILRDISRKPGKTQFYFSRLLPLRIFLSLFAYVLALFLGLILGRSLRQIFYLAILGIGLFPYSFNYLVASFQNARERMRSMAAINIATPTLMAGLGLAFVLMEFSLAWIFFASVLANFIVASIVFSRLRPWGLFSRWEVDWPFWLKSLKQSWVFAALTVLAVFYLRLSLLLVGFIKGPYFTGLYGSAFKFIEAGILIPQSLALALFPLSSRLYVNNKKLLTTVYKKGLAVLFFFSLPFALVLLFGSKLIIGFAYGQGYLPSSPVLSVLGIAIILFFVNALPGNIILNSPKARNFLPLAALNFLVIVFLGLLLVSRHSILGAAWAVVGGEAAGLIINNWFVYRLLKEQ